MEKAGIDLWHRILHMIVPLKAVWEYLYAHSVTADDAYICSLQGLNDNSKFNSFCTVYLYAAQYLLVLQDSSAIWPILTAQVHPKH